MRVKIEIFEKTYLFDRFLSFLDLAELDVAKTEELMFRVDWNLTAQNFSVAAKFGVEIYVWPLDFLEALDENGGALDIFATRLPSDSVHVVWESPAHLVSFDHGESVFFHSSLGIFDGVEHDKSVVEVFEQRSIVNKKRS